MKIIEIHIGSLVTSMNQNKRVDAKHVESFYMKGI